MLVEKPLATGSDGLDDLVSAGKGRLMVGYNLRLHEPIRRLVDLVHGGRVGRVSSVRVWFGSWLPDWRPAVDYRTTYSARADLGGGVLFDAIHELDILVWLLGVEPFDVVGAVVDRLGPLEIDVEDTVKAVLRHSSGVAAEVSLDYLSRRYRRGIEVVGDAATVRLDWARSVLEIEDGDGIEVQAADGAGGRVLRPAGGAVPGLRGRRRRAAGGRRDRRRHRSGWPKPIRRRRDRRPVSTLVVVQARAGSTRLPGKVLMPVGGRPMLAFMLARLESVRCDDLVVATSTDGRDDAVAEVAAAAGVSVVRGSESDVLARFVAALDAHPADVVVRLTADCPLIDPAVVNEAIAVRAATGADYASNTLVRTYPDGLDVEVLTADALRAAAAEAVDPVEREHVTPFVYRRPERFRLAAVVGPEPLGDLRWTVDTADDLDRIRTHRGRARRPADRRLAGDRGRRRPARRRRDVAPADPVAG